MLTSVIESSTMHVPLQSLATHAAVIGASAIVAAVFAKFWPFLNRLLHAEVHVHSGRARTDQLDGLRGILCLAVMVHHAAITLSLKKTADWLDAAGITDAHWLSGGMAVGLFFSVTAFLFYDRAVRTGGVLDAREFLIQRVGRIGPGVLATLLLCIGFDAVYEHRFFYPGGAGRLILCAGSLAAYPGGIIPYNASVFWTLGYEWVFYLAFPLLAASVAMKVHPLMRVVGCVAVATLATGGLLSQSTALMFIPGLIAVHTRRNERFVRFASSWPASVLVVFVMFALLWTGTMSGGRVSQVGALIVFPLIVAGADIFGLLRLSALRALGLASYSIYLLHGFALYAARPWLLAHADHALVVWSGVTGLAVIVTLAAFASFRWIEVPGIAWGKHMAHRSTRGTVAANASTPNP